MAEKKDKIASLEKESEKPEFWSDPQSSGELSKELSDLKEEVREFEQLQKEFDDLKEFAKLSAAGEDAGSELFLALESLQKRVEKQEVRTFLSGKHDKANAIVTVVAGAGGQDAQDWAAMLFRMYERYCERKGWRTEILHQSFGELGSEGRIGVKQASLEIIGSFAYGLLKQETGVHRLVRLSPFSSKSLRHTSFAAVEVLPEVNHKDEEIEIRPDDLQFDFYRASGPGGQNVNKRETAVRLTHIPTGIIVSSQVQRSQQRNKEKALQVLASKLYQAKEKEHANELISLKGKQASIEWGSQIRSYVLHPYKMVKDLRTDLETSNVEEVLDGDLEAFIEAETLQGKQ